MLRIDKAPIPNINFPMPFKPFEHMALTHPQSCCGSKKRKANSLKKKSKSVCRLEDFHITPHVGGISQEINIT